VSEPLLIEQLRAAHAELSVMGLEAEAVNPLLPDVRLSLERMIETVEADAATRQRIAAGFDRLVLEDVRLSRTVLGARLLQLSEAYATSS
jgi:hypothetical protein